MKHTAAVKHVKNVKPLRHTNSVKRKAHHAARNAHSFIGNIVDRSEAALSSAEAQVGAVMHQTQGYKNTIENYIEENPIKAVGIAAAVGVVLAFVWRHI